jgi:acyl-CoA synthetase (AMP-forming)/AMP-acid ligase II
VNPDTLEEVGDGVEGEIWLSSPSNGVGYWEMPEATKQTFGVQLKGCSMEDADIKFVRSGDLGRVIEGILFVTGRIKDLIVVHGKNYYPSDIEKTVENCSNSLKPGKIFFMYNLPVTYMDLICLNFKLANYSSAQLIELQTNHLVTE